jgi:uncharacterized protein YdaU (DUF1376 family)
MTDWYKMNPVDWNDGTDDLTLEQEAAYLRLCHAIYITERPIRDNGFVIAGLLRCNDRKAKRLISELEAAGKITVENGVISNRRAAEEVSNRNRTRAERKSAGSRGGVESAKARAKPLENNEPSQAIASTHVEPEEIREEESREPLTPSKPKRYANPCVVLQSIVDPMTAQRYVGYLEEKRRPLVSATAEELVSTLRQVQQLGGNPAEALHTAIRKGWLTIEIEYLRNAGFKFTQSAAAASIDWPGRMKNFNEFGIWPMAWGPKPGDPGCEAPAELLNKTAA